MKPDYQFVDVFGMDPDLLAMIPQPCRAMLLLFPINEKVRAVCGVTFVMQDLFVGCCS